MKLPFRTQKTLPIACWLRRHAKTTRKARFSSEAIKALGPAGLLGIMLPADVGGSALGPRTFAAVVATLAEADASVAMVYLMHVCAAATIAAARNGAAVAPTLKEIAAGRHLSTLAFSEAGSRSHFWAPVSRARRNRGRSPHHGQKVLCDERRPSAQLCGLGAGPGGHGPYRLDALSHSKRRTRAVGRGRLGRSWFAGQRLRADDPRGLRSCRPSPN